MRNPFAAIAEKVLTRESDRAAARQAEMDLQEAQQRAAENEALLRESYELASRHRASRNNDRFEERMRAAYRGERHA